MTGSKATTAAGYLAELPPERREVVATVRDLVNRNLPDGYVESMNFGMICWEIPLARYPVTYNKQPLMYAALAANKNGYSLYLLCTHTDSKQEATLREAYAKAGRKLDMGKSCLRFKQTDDLLNDAIARLIASTTVEAYIKVYEASRKK
jgi:hypothetical protein